MDDAQKQWLVDFHQNVLERLARRAEANSWDGCPVRAEPCPDHDAACVRVTHGILCQHVGWVKIAPAEAAAAALAILLPVGVC